MFSCNVCALPHCCGFYEAGEFGQHAGKLTWKNFQEESPEKLVKKVLAHSDGRPVIFNFVKQCLEDDEGDDIEGEFQDEYECHELRDYVRTFPKVIDLGRHVNPGTNNKIHSLVIKDY